MLALSLPAQLLAFSAPGAALVRPLTATQQPARCVAKAEIEQLAELAKKVPVADLPEPIQPWAKEYLGQLRVQRSEFIRAKTKQASRCE